MTYINYEKLYNQYARDVIDGNIIACKAIHQACERYISWFDRKDIYFDYDDTDRKIRFIQKLKHSTGVHNGHNFILLPWQAWVIAGIFGFKYKDTGTRVIKNVFLFLSRKTGKTALAAAISIACSIVDNEPGAEIDLVANSAKQASIAFDHCYNFCESVDPKKQVFKRFRDTIKIPRTNSKIQVLASDSMTLDGYNSSVFIIDEFHAAKDWDLYNVMKSSQGMRSQPLGIIITTAGYLLGDYPCYQYYTMCKDILSMKKKDDSLFAAIYELDEDDDWKDHNNWIKCTPSLGQTVYETYMQDQVTTAANNVALEVGVKTKNMNMFCQSVNTWIYDDVLRSVMQPISFDVFKDQETYMGVDLSATQDLTAWTLMMPPDKSREFYPDKFIFKSVCYIPKDILDKTSNSGLYKMWVRNGVAKVTSGNVVDYDFILKDQLEQFKDTCLLNVAYDSFNATQWAINATSEGMPLEPFSQALANFNKPTKLLEMLINSGRCVIDANSLVLWAFSNVEIKIDSNDNYKPTKSNGEKNKKIDPVISMIQALGGYLEGSHFNPEVFSL